MKISDILSEKIIKTDLECTDKDDAINKIIDLASKSGLMLDIEKVRECVFEGKNLFRQAWEKGLRYRTERQMR